MLKDECWGEGASKHCPADSHDYTQVVLALTPPCWLFGDGERLALASYSYCVGDIALPFVVRCFFR